MAFNFLFLSWIVSLVATLASLFYSEVMLYVPCSLCWYQRIAMYPLVLILAFGLFPLDRKVFRFAMPLATLGWTTALYHNLLHWKIVPEDAATCLAGVPCTIQYVNYFGFVTIPLMAFLAFSLIIVFLYLFRRQLNKVSYL